MHLLLALCTIAFGTWPPIAIQGALPQSFAISGDARVLTIDEELGDRPFTQVHATYDARNFRLLDARQRGSCCGSSFSDEISINDDGTYDITTVNENGPRGEQRDRVPSFEVPPGPVLVASYYLIPWIVHATHATTITELDLSPFSEARAASTRPVHIKALDKGTLELTSTFADGRHERELLAYDPCTSVVNTITREF